MTAQLTMRDILFKLGFAENQLHTTNPLLDYKVVIEDPLSNERARYKCDGVFVGENVIHLHMGDEVLN